MINAEKDVNVSHLLGICRCNMGDNNKKAKNKCATFSLTDWGDPTRNAWKLCHDDFSLFPYKIQLSHPLSEDEIRET